MVQITPLGAAVWEVAQRTGSVTCPEVKEIMSDFETHNRCPTSKLFNAEAIRNYYDGKIEPVEKP